MDKSIMLQILTVSVVALLATVGVYGIVALIVRMDDLGHSIIKKSTGEDLVFRLGKLLVNSLPVIIRVLSIGGTIALILVAGGIFVHNIDFLHHLMPDIPSFIYEFFVGLIVGLLAFGLFSMVKGLLAYFKS